MSTGPISANRPDPPNFQYDPTQFADYKQNSDLTRPNLAWPTHDDAKSWIFNI